MSKKKPYTQDNKDKLADPEHLDDLLIVIPQKGWLILFVISLIIMAVILWLFYGIIPIELEGKGIAMHFDTQFQTIRSYSPGVVNNLYVKTGDIIEIGTVIAEIIDPSKKEISNTSTVLSPFAGKIIKISTEEGESIQAGTPIIWLEQLAKDDQPLVFYCFFPSQCHAIPKIGTQVFLNLPNGDIDSWGELVGTVQQISKEPVSKDSVGAIIHNNDIVNAIFKEADTAWQVIVYPNTKKGTTELVWKDRRNHNLKIGTGTVVAAKAIINAIKPIEYIFPTQRQEDGC